MKLWGARGSLPTPRTPQSIEHDIRAALEEFLDSGFKSKNDINEFLRGLPRHRIGGFGGNTPCVEVRSPQQQIIIDAGSGIRSLGYELMSGPCAKGQGEVHLFFTHFHWDHLIGLPFFVPIFVPGNRIHVYAVQTELPEMFRTLFHKPFFPVPLERLGAKIEYHILEPRKPVSVGDLTLTPYELDHPDPCWGFRVESGGKSLAYCVDTEGVRISPEQLGPDLPLYRGADLMVFDAQYTLMETLERVNWGHAAASLGLDIAIREKIRKVVFMHHDPASSDEKIMAAEAQAARYYRTQQNSARRTGAELPDVDWCFGYEGMVIEI